MQKQVQNLQNQVHIAQSIKSAIKLIYESVYESASEFAAEFVEQKKQLQLSAFKQSLLIIVRFDFLIQFHFHHTFYKSFHF